MMNMVNKSSLPEAQNRDTPPVPTSTAHTSDAKPSNPGL